MSGYRVGIGVDAHALEAGVPLVLGGVELEHPRGLAGHSDGDVIAHALIDAILGAAGLGDIGSLFPTGDEAVKWLYKEILNVVRVRANGVPIVGFTWYSITGSPLFTLGAQLRSRYRLPRCTFGVPGASGWRSGCSGSDHGDGSERPAAFTATMRNW